MASGAPIALSVSHRGRTYPLSFPSDSTVAQLQSHLETLTSIPPSLQKLLYRGKPSIPDPQTLTLANAGFKDGMKVQMLGSSVQEIESVKAAEDQKNKRERILQERARKAPVKPRSTSASTSSEYRFHRIEPLPHLPDPPSALEVLQRLGNDPAILHVMKTHQFSVPLLTELGPHEEPLGLNQNYGAIIRIRIRTPQCDGFLPYSGLRKTLSHELTHNVWGDHDDNFKKLNSQLNREVAEFERAAREGTHRLSSNDVYEPEVEEEAFSNFLGEGSYVLGGNATPESTNQHSRDERRRLALEAAMNRLRKEEEELEKSCGTVKHTK